MAQELRTEENEHTEKLRAEAAALLAQAQTQLAEVQRALAGAGGDSALHAKLSAAANHLSAIVSQLSQAVASPKFSLRAADLIGIQGVVNSGEAHAAVAEASTAGAQAGAYAAAYAAAGPNVAAASLETRRETETLARDVFDQRIFDPYLRFKSPNDEEEYRKREADNKRYIQQQLAKHTPEGDLNAGGGMIGQMLDAHAHGAGNSPDFLPKYNAIVEKAERERAALRAAGRSTAEYDSHVGAGVRRLLKDEGHLSDAEISRRLSGGVNPLDVAKPYLEQGGSSSMKALDDAAKPRIEPTENTKRPDTKLSITVADLGSQLAAAGVKSADKPEEAPAHGLTNKNSTEKTDTGRRKPQLNPVG